MTLIDNYDKRAYWGFFLVIYYSVISAFVMHNSNTARGL